MSRAAKFTLVDWVRVFLSVKNLEEDKRFEAFKAAALEKAESLGLKESYLTLDVKGWMNKINTTRSAVAQKTRLVDGKVVGVYKKSGEDTLYMDKDCKQPMPENAAPYILPTVTVSSGKSRANMDDLLGVLSEFPVE